MLRMVIELSFLAADYFVLTLQERMKREHCIF
jgi:hypothetical protein